MLAAVDAFTFGWRFGNIQEMTNVELTNVEGMTKPELRNPAPSP